jgi:hypothetical protein
MHTTKNKQTIEVAAFVNVVVASSQAACCSASGRIRSGFNQTSSSSFQFLEPCDQRPGALLVTQFVGRFRPNNGCAAVGRHGIIATPGLFFAGSTAPLLQPALSPCVADPSPTAGSVSCLPSTALAGCASAAARQRWPTRRRHAMQRSVRRTAPCGGNIPPTRSRLVLPFQAPPQTCLPRTIPQHFSHYLAPLFLDYEADGAKYKASASVMPLSRASSDTGLFCGGIICRRSASFRSSEYCITQSLLPVPDTFYFIR